MINTCMILTNPSRLGKKATKETSVSNILIVMNYSLFSHPYLALLPVSYDVCFVFCPSVFLDHWLPSRLWILCRDYLVDKGKHVWKRIVLNVRCDVLSWGRLEGQGETPGLLWSPLLSHFCPHHISPPTVCSGTSPPSLTYLCVLQTCSLPLKIRHHYYRGVGFPRIPGFFQ